MAKITDLIEGYADMSAEEKLTALEALDQPAVDDTEAKKWKAQYDKTAHELAEQKKTAKGLQEQLQSRMSEEELTKEQQKAELEAIIKERDELKRQSAISKTMAQYIALGYSQELAESTANALYDGDIDTVLSDATKHNEEVEKQIRTKIVSENPTPTGKGAGTPKPMTKAEIMAIKDTAKRQKAISENMDLFDKGE